MVAQMSRVAPDEPAWGWLQEVFDANPTLAAIFAPFVVLLLWFLTLIVGRLLLVATLNRVVTKTAVGWDDELVASRVPRKLAWLFPFGVVYLVIDSLPGLSEGWRMWIARGAQVGMILSVLNALHSVLDFCQDLYEKREDAKRRPIKGYVQLAKLILSIAGLALSFAAILGSEVSTLLTGLGVSTAVVLLAFKDTILAVQASLHLQAYDMVRIGDWIEMPKFGADGDVIDMALHTVRVRNFDKTFVTIPTVELTTSSFRNWRGMQESGGRRIKRHISIDVHSIRFLSKDDVQRLGQNPAMGEHMQALRDSVAQRIESESMTNLAAFRLYLGTWLRSHPDVHDDMTILVRELQVTDRGLPLELYLFTKTTKWGEYERIQAEMFEHLFAVMGDFGLEPYQLPSQTFVPDA